MTGRQAASPDAPAAERQNGLSADELRAEQAGDLPEREAMSILDVGGLHVGLPTPGDLDGVLDTADPLDGQPALGVIDPIDGGGQIPADLGSQLPVDVSGQNPLEIVDHLPIDNLPLDGGDPGNLPTDGGGLIGIPEQPALAVDTETVA